MRYQYYQYYAVVALQSAIVDAHMISYHIRIVNEMFEHVFVFLVVND